MVVNSRGEFDTRLVKMNSNLLPLNLVMMYSDWVWPLSLVLAVRVLMETMAPYPMLRLMFLLLLDTHMVRRLVTTSSPLSPVFPFVSSTPWR